MKNSGIYNEEFLELCERVSKHEGTQDDRKRMATILFLDDKIDRFTLKQLSKKNPTAEVVEVYAYVGITNYQLQKANDLMNELREERENSETNETPDETPEKTQFCNHTRILIITLVGIWATTFAFILWFMLSN